MLVSFSRRICRTTTFLLLFLALMAFTQETFLGTALGVGTIVVGMIVWTEARPARFDREQEGKA